MASSRSVRNGASSTAPSDPALIQRLLVEGTAHPLDAVISGAASQLEKAGIIVVRREEYVKCRHEMDRDFPYSRADCTALVPLHPDLDEEDGDIRCPKCDRVIRPTLSNKERFHRLIPALHHEGIQRWMQSTIATVGTTQLVAPGVWSCQNPAWPSSRFVVLIDQVDDQSQYVTEQWAQSTQVIFVAVNPSLTGLESISWATPTPLAALIAGTEDLAARIHQAPDWSQKPRVNASTRLYSTGRRAVLFQPAQAASAGRQFIIELTDRQLLINDQPMLPANAKSQMAVFRILLEPFGQDLGAYVSLGEYRSLTIDEIADELTKLLDKGAEVVGAETARTHINRFQRDIAEKWRKLVGSPMNEHDIIQTMTGDGREGYRINPSTVIIRPRRS